jgi:hypothetical protein
MQHWHKGPGPETAAATRRKGNFNKPLRHIILLKIKKKAAGSSLRVR